MADARFIVSDFSEVFPGAKHKLGRHRPFAKKESRRTASAYRWALTVFVVCTTPSSPGLIVALTSYQIHSIIKFFDIGMRGFQVRAFVKTNNLFCKLCVLYTAPETRSGYSRLPVG